MDSVPDFFEEAFQRIEPKDDAHREKLEKMRQRFRQIRAEAAAEIGKVKAEIQEHLKPVDPSNSENIRSRSEAAKQSREEMRLELEIHAELIENIAVAIKSRRP